MNAAMTWLREQLDSQYGAQGAEVWAGLEAERVTSCRVNTLKTDRTAVAAAFQAAGLACETAPCYADALVLPHGSEPAIRKLEVYTEGRIYLQSLSAMLPPLLLGAQAGEDVLDMCAAPGGKTSEIVQLTRQRAMVTACEPDRVRCDRLRSNLKRLGCERVNVLNTDARKLDDLFRFDRILLDAPCSGSGTLRPGESAAFSEKLVVNSARLQRQLLEKACGLLKRGGTLVYSTCSVLRQENEETVRAVLRKPGLRLRPVPPDAFPGLRLLENTLPGTLTVCPDDRFEGFYISVIEKNG